MNELGAAAKANSTVLLTAAKRRIELAKRRSQIIGSSITDTADDVRNISVPPFVTRTVRPVEVEVRE